MPQMIGTDTYGTTEEYGAGTGTFPPRTYEEYRLRGVMLPDLRGVLHPESIPDEHHPRLEQNDVQQVEQVSHVVKRVPVLRRLWKHAAARVCLVARGIFGIGAAIVSQRHRFCHCNPCTVLHCTTSR